LLPRTLKDVIVDGDDVWLELGRTKNGQPVQKYVDERARWALQCLPFSFGDKRNSVGRSYRPAIFSNGMACSAGFSSI